MPVHMRQQRNGKWVVVEPDGTIVFGPTTRQKAREVVAGRNIGEMRSKGDPRAPRKPRGR